MQRVKGYCAGILVFSEDVAMTELQNLLKTKKCMLQRGELSVTFGSMGNVQTIRELCVDVFDRDGRYRPDLSVAFKC